MNLDRDRELRRKVDDLFRANKQRQFTIDEIASRVGISVAELTATLHAAIRCPYGSCQSYDTVLSEGLENGFEVHRCNRCDRNIHVQRDAHGYSIVGWYGE